MRILVLLVAIIVCASAYVKPDPLLDGLICSVCTDVVTDAENAGLDYSETWLKNEFAEYCKALGPFNNLCIKAMTDVISDLDTYIRQALEPTLCCQKVKLCK